MVMAINSNSASGVDKKVSIVFIVRVGLPNAYPVAYVDFWDVQI
ncbi:MAG: hypothetical protein ACJAY8_000014 [Sphingobacteriales bacterium]|jgi:hypothetical protein